MGDSSEVGAFLSRLDLSQFVHAFEKEGYDDFKVVTSMSKDDMRTLGMQEEDMLKLLKGLEVRKFLLDHQLSQYILALFEQGYDDMDLVAEMPAEVIDQCIAKAGHRKKMQSALEKLASARPAPQSVLESPATLPDASEGGWEGEELEKNQTGGWSSTSWWEAKDHTWWWAPNYEATDEWHWAGTRSPEEMYTRGSCDAWPMEVDGHGAPAEKAAIANVFEHQFAHLDWWQDLNVSAVLRSPELRERFAVSEELSECTSADWCANRYKQKYQEVKDIPLKAGKAEYQHDEMCALNKAALLPVLAACRHGCYQVGEDVGNVRTLKLDMIRNTKFEPEQLEILENDVAPTAFKKFPKTEVLIQDSDCLSLARELQKTLERPPTVLNMANADHPGGGFDSGRVAQEEDMFRRTTLVAALPGPFGDLCFSGSTKLGKVVKVGYPLAELGVVFTENVEILRGEQFQGFPFLEEPVVFNVLTCAAYEAQLGKRLASKHQTAVGPTRVSAEERDRSGTPTHPAEQNAVGMLELTPTYAMLTHQKLRSLLLVARDRNCDTLILSALGCGAFGNPAEHVAFIFREVIAEFAGAFDRIYFAIKRGKDGRNLRIFQEVFGDRDKSTFTPLKQVPLPIFSARNRIRMLTSMPKKICTFGGSCRDQSSIGCNFGSHGCSQAFHPSLCQDNRCEALQKKGKTAKHVRWHAELYSHADDCEYGAQCPYTDNELHTKVAKHNFEKCHAWSRCSDRRKDHERYFKHPPICGYWDRGACERDPKHMEEFRHPDKPQSCHETVCFQWMDPEHMRECHSYWEGKEWKVQQVCRYMNCNRMHKNKNHVKEYLHVHLPPCKDKNCRSVDSDHLDIYFHNNTARKMGDDGVCRDGRRCTNLALEHQRDRRHEPGVLPLCPPYTMRPFWTIINYQENLDRLRKFLDRSSIFNGHTMDENFKNISQHVKSLRPVHRCNAKVFRSVLESKKLFSLLQLSGTESKRPKAFDMVLDMLQAKKFNAGQLATARTYMEDYLIPGKELSALDWGSFRFQLGKTAMEEMKTKFDQCKQWEQTLKEAPSGIGYKGDEVMGLNDTIFAIFGPHNTESYGQIQLIFDPIVMQHPNAYLLPCAGTFFNSGGGRKFKGMKHDSPLIERTWVPKEEKPPHAMTDRARMENFTKNMWNCSVDKWWEVIAKELIARTMLWLGYGAPGKVKWEDILEFNEACEGHSWLEAHLPRELPLEYVTDVVMPASLGPPPAPPLAPTFPSTGCLAELATMGLDKDKIKEMLGKDIRLTVKPTAAESKKEARKLACGKESLFSPGFAFSTQETEHDSTFHPSAGIVLGKDAGRRRGFRFKASADAKFNIVLASTPLRFCQRMSPLIDESAYKNELVVVITFLAGHVNITVEQERLEVEGAMETYRHFTRLRTGARSDAAQWTTKFLDYLIELTPTDLTLKHRGSSELFLCKNYGSNNAGGRKQTSINYKFPRGFILGGPVYVGCSAKHVSIPATIFDMQLVEEDERADGCHGHFEEILKKPERQLPRLAWVAVKDPKTLCTAAAALNMPLEMCPLGAEHHQRFRHVCKYGRSCRYMQEGSESRGGSAWMEHHQQFCHKGLTNCRDGRACKELWDPSHRVKFHHPGNPKDGSICDWIAMCPVNPCPQRGDKLHDLNWCHQQEKLDDLLQACLSQHW